MSHTFEPSGKKPVHFLDLHTPNSGFGAFVRAMGKARDEEGSRSARAAFDEVTV